MSGCHLRLELVPLVGYVLRGEHGEEVRFGVSEVLAREALPEAACPAFVTQALQIFGPGGPRSLGAEEPFIPHGLGRRPMSQVDDAELLARLGLLR